MAKYTFGGITIEVSDEIALPAEAGSMDKTRVKRIKRERGGMVETADETGQAIQQNPEDFKGCDVDADVLARSNAQVKAFNQVLAGLEEASLAFGQGNLLYKEQVHEGLRKTLAFVRGRAKFDRSIVSKVPKLDAYFAVTTKKATPE